MRYYAQYNDSGALLAIGTGAGGVEITESEYNALLSEIREKAALVNRLYSGEIIIDAVPVDWQEEIQCRVDERIAAEGSAEEQDISAEEALDILLGGATTGVELFPMWATGTAYAVDDRVQYNGKLYKCLQAHTAQADWNPVDAPFVIDRDGVVVIGHCRALAAKKLGMKEVPCVCVDDLTPEQVNALRLVDNKSNESDWDFDLLADELPGLDLSAFDFDFGIEDEEEDFDENDLERDDEKDGGVLIQITFRNLQEYKNAENAIKNIIGDATMTVKMV